MTTHHEIPPFRVSILQGMPLRARLKRLRQVVGDQLEFESGFVKWSNKIEELISVVQKLDEWCDETKELVIIVKKISSLSIDPFCNTIFLKQKPLESVYISHSHGLTFIHVVQDKNVYLCEAICPWDSLVKAEQGGISTSSLAQLIMASLPKG